MRPAWLESAGVTDPSHSFEFTSSTTSTAFSLKLGGRLVVIEVALLKCSEFLRIQLHPFFHSLGGKGILHERFSSVWAEVVAGQGAKLCAAQRGPSRASKMG